MTLKIKEQSPTRLVLEAPVHAVWKILTPQKKPMVVTIDVEDGFAKVTGGLGTGVPGETSELKLDLVRYIELTWEDPRFGEVNLILCGLDGSCLFIDCGDVYTMNVLAEKIQKLLNKPINNDDIRTNPVFDSK